MLHPWPMVRGYVEDEVDGGRGPMTCMWSKEFYETDPKRDFVRGYTLQFSRGTGPANEAVTSTAVGPGSPGVADHHREYRGAGSTAAPADDRDRLRGSARGAQPGDARPGAKGQPRHPGAKDRLHDQREHPPDDGTRDRPRRGDPDRGGGDRPLHLAHDPQQPGPPLGHGADGATTPSARSSITLGPQPRSCSTCVSSSMAASGSRRAG